MAISIEAQALVKLPQKNYTGPERLALRNKLIALGFSTGDAARIANANSVSLQVREGQLVCKQLPKG